MSEMTMDDKLATIDSLILGAITMYGGETIIAGPKMEQLVRDIREGLEQQGWLALSSCGEPIAVGWVLKVGEKDWCDGELGYRHLPVYDFEEGALALAKEMGCEAQLVGVFALPAKEPA